MWLQAELVPPHQQADKFGCPTNIKPGLKGLSSGSGQQHGRDFGYNPGSSCGGPYLPYSPDLGVFAKAFGGTGVPQSVVAACVVSQTHEDGPR